MAEAAQARIVVSAVDNATAGIRRVNEAVRDMTKPVGRVERAVSDLNQEFRQLSEASGLSRIRRTLQGAAGDVRNVGDGISRAFGRAARIGGTLGIVGGGAATGLGALVQQETRAAEETARMARRFGIARQSLQEFRFAGREVGLEAETVTDGIKELGLRAADAAQGNKRFTEAFRQLGIQVTDSSGKVRDTEALIRDVSSALSEMDSATRRNFFATELFGDEGAQLVRLLARTNEEIDGLRQKARETFNVTSDEDQRRLEAFGTTLRAVTNVVSGFRKQVAIALAPELRPIIEDVIAWTRANRDLIQSRIAEFASRVGDAIRALGDPTSAIREVIAAVTTTVRIAAGAFNFLSSVVGAGTLVIGGLATVIGGPLLTAMGSTARLAWRLGRTMGGVLVRGATLAIPALRAIPGALAAIRTGLFSVKAALVSTGIGIALVGLGTVASLIISNWQTVRSWFGDFFGWLGDQVRAVVNGLASIASVIPGVDLSGVGSEANRQVQSEASKIQAPNVPVSAEVQETRRRRVQTVDAGGGTGATPATTTATRRDGPTGQPAPAVTQTPARGGAGAQPSQSVTVNIDKVEVNGAGQNVAEETAENLADKVEDVFAERQRRQLF